MDYIERAIRETVAKDTDLQHPNVEGLIATITKNVHQAIIKATKHTCTTE